MKVLYKNTTKYTKETFEKFQQFHQNKYGLRYTIMTVVVVLLFTFCLVINFKYGYPLIGFLFLFGIIVFLIYRYKEPIRRLKKQREAESIKQESEFTFSFYERYMKVSGYKINQKLRYWNLKKAFEDKGYIYLYINDDYAFVLKKDGFSIGKSKEFFPFIKKKILFKI